MFTGESNTGKLSVNRGQDGKHTSQWGGMSGRICEKQFLFVFVSAWFEHNPPLPAAWVSKVVGAWMRLDEDANTLPVVSGPMDMPQGHVVGTATGSSDVDRPQDPGTKRESMEIMYQISYRYVINVAYLVGYVSIFSFTTCVPSGLVGGPHAS